MAEGFDAVRAALQDAYQLLSYRAWTVEEMRGRLKKKGHQAVLTTVIDRLKELGLLDDEAFAQTYLEYAQQSKPMGPKRLQYELERRGIERSFAKHAIARFITPEIERRLAERAAREKMRKSAISSADLNDAKVQRRLFSFLARRGFSYPIVRDLVVDLRAHGDQPTNAP